ncbi:MAG TPA: hypothetical protein VFZ58_00725 [Candidatus Saccharimonadales bacterium]
MKKPIMYKTAGKNGVIAWLTPDAFDALRENGGYRLADSAEGSELEQRIAAGTLTFVSESSYKLAPRLYTGSFTTMKVLAGICRVMAFQDPPFEVPFSSDDSERSALQQGRGFGAKPKIAAALFVQGAEVLMEEADKRGKSQRRAIRDHLRAAS